MIHLILAAPKQHTCILLDLHGWCSILRMHLRPFLLLNQVTTGLLLEHFQQQPQHSKGVWPASKNRIKHLRALLPSQQSRGGPYTGTVNTNSATKLLKDTTASRWHMMGPCAGHYCAQYLWCSQKDDTQLPAPQLPITTGEGKQRTT